VVLRSGPRRESTASQAATGHGKCGLVERVAESGYSVEMKSNPESQTSERTGQLWAQIREVWVLGFVEALNILWFPNRVGAP
jgi:hypothetical protein